MAHSPKTEDNSLQITTDENDEGEKTIDLWTPETNWAHFLLPASSAIFLFGQLMAVSAFTDFSLENDAPNCGFKLLKHPSSFRACLVQVINDSWSAFSKAHTNMNKIRLRTDGVEKHVKKATSLLVAGRKEEIVRLVPNALRKISCIANSCKDQAQEIESAFGKVTDLLAELLEASASAKRTYEESYAKSVARLKDVEMRKEEKENNRNDIKKVCDKSKTDIESLQKDVKSAVDQVPTAMQLIGVSAAEVPMRLVKNVGGVWNKGTSFLFTIPSLFTELISSSQVEESTNLDAKSYEIQAYTAASTMSRLVDRLQKISIQKNVESDSEKDNLKRELSEIRQQLKEIENEWSQDSFKFTYLYTNKKGTELCDDLSSVIESPDEQKEKDMAKEITKVKKMVNILEKKCEEQIRKKATQQKQLPESLVSMINENAKYKVEHAIQSLEKARSSYEMELEMLKRENEELHELMREMAALDPQKVEFGVIKDKLHKGIEALSNVKQQWGNLVQFFTTMSECVQCSLDSSLQEFVDTAEVRRENSMQDEYTSSAVFQEMIKHDANEASAIAYAVQSIARTYVDVSGKYFMGKIGEMTKYIVVQEKDAKTIQNKLFFEHKEVQVKIRKLMEDHCSQYTTKIKERKKKLEEAFASYLPSTTESTGPKVKWQ